MPRKSAAPDPPNPADDAAFNDARFTKITRDPRFMRPKKKDAKVTIDERFSKMLHDDEFGAVAKVDKYGRPVEKSKGQDLKKYYKLESDQEEEFDPARGKGVVASSDSDESNADEAFEVEENDLFDRLGPFATEDIPEGEETKRLAIVNMDWDNIKATDLFKVVESFTPKGGSIVSVRIYPSEFGKERMAKEAVEGPPRNIFADAEPEDEDVDEAVRKELFSNQDGKEFNEEKLREYQLERLRYYYAVVECDSVGTARTVYQECDGAEFEKTSNVFDIRYVPDDMEFDEPTDEALEPPATYRPADFVTRALQQSNVKLTWDEDDRERVRVTQRKFTKDDLKRMDFDAYVASSSDESGSDVEARKARLRGALLNDDGEDDQNGEIEITFTPGLGSKAQELLDKRQEKLDRSKESVFEAKQRERREKKKGKKAMEAVEVDGSEDEFFQQPSTKSDKSRTHGKHSKKSKEDKLQDEQSRAELELLMADNSKVQHFDMKEVLDAEKPKRKRGKKVKQMESVQDGFQVDTADPRFSGMFDSHEFAIDPTNPSFKKTKNMEKLLNVRSDKLEKQEQQKDKPASKFDLLKRKNDDLDQLVASVKRKSKSNSLPSSKKAKK